MGKYTIEQEKKMLETSYQMYETTKLETEKKMREKIDENGDRKYDDEDIREKIELIQSAEDDIIQKYLSIGGTIEELSKCSKTNEKKKKKSSSKSKDKKDIMDRVLESFEVKDDKNNVKDEENVFGREFLPKNINPSQDTYYDIIPLPSNGECYRNKMGKIPVAYLTAYDENMILSPNLYNNKLIIDYMLKEKVLNDEIDTDDLLEGDREAIILYLRASGYGNEYPIKAKDKVTGEDFETVIDLSQLKFKPFKLKGDVNGWFDFTLPISKKVVKFKFLTHKDMVMLKKSIDIESKMLTKDKLGDIVATMDYFIENDDEMIKTDKIKYKNAIRTIENWKDSISEEDSIPYTHVVTNRLELEVMSIDGITDRKIIREFIHNMNIRDSYELRRYIDKNEPGIDYNFTIKKPESLGGGSQDVYFQFDEYIFLNIAD